MTMHCDLQARRRVDFSQGGGSSRAQAGGQGAMTAANGYDGHGGATGQQDPESLFHPFATASHAPNRAAGVSYGAFLDVESVAWV